MPGEFTRYIDERTGKYLGDHVGRCNREVNCGYHLPPSKYSQDITYGGIDLHSMNKKQTDGNFSVIPEEFLLKSLTKYSQNNFVSFLDRKFGSEVTHQLIQRFYIGTSQYWDGATVFWQIDIQGRIRSGKIMEYDSTTGRRVKEKQVNGSVNSKITWVHSVLLQKHLLPSFNLKQCYFGEHQLSSKPKDEPIGIVESEKTAIVASVKIPRFTWLACGSLNNMSTERSRVLSGQRIVLFPDLKCLSKWQEKGKELESVLGCNVSVFEFLEKNATDIDRSKGLDLADYLLRDEKPTHYPDTIYIPSELPNTIEEISKCLANQRVL
jgi:hypothetical protein